MSALKFKTSADYLKEPMMGKDHNQMSLKTRWMIWRARYSVPALLMRLEERKAVSLIAAINGGVSILTIGVAAWLTDLPLVFPALGPSTFILCSTPMSAGAAPRSVILGHWICLAVGFMVWHLMSYLTGAPVSVADGGWTLFCSATLALALSCLALVWVSCPHPPSCASSLVVALGMVTAWQDLLLMAVVVVWLAYQAVALNRLAGVPVPKWAPSRQG